MRELQQLLRGEMIDSGIRAIACLVDLEQLRRLQGGVLPVPQVVTRLPDERVGGDGVLGRRRDRKLQCSTGTIERDVEAVRETHPLRQHLRPHDRLGSAGLHVSKVNDLSRVRLAEVVAIRGEDELLLQSIERESAIVPWT